MLVVDVVGGGAWFCGRVVDVDVVVVVVVWIAVEVEVEEDEAGCLNLFDVQ